MKSSVLIRSAYTLFLFVNLGLLSSLSSAPKIPEVPSDVILKQDLAFLAPEREEKLDLYQSKDHTSDKRVPAVVIIHGGGWRNGDKYRMREYVTGTTLAQAGYVAVSINYELRAPKRWPNNLHDCKNAVRWLRLNADSLGVDPDRIGVIGGSAGGHLAMMVAYTPNDPKLSSEELYPGISDHVSACVNMYGISNLLTRSSATKDGTPTDELRLKTNLFKKSREEAPALWRNASPVTHVKADSPPTLIYHGSADTVVDRDQSNELFKVLQEAGVESTLNMVEGATHAWPLKTKNFDFTAEMVAFFDRHLRKAKIQPAE